MEHPIRSAFSFFGQKYERLLLLVLFIQLPIILLQFFASNYILAITPTNGAMFGFGDIYSAFIVFILFFFTLVPFVYFWHFEETGHDRPLRQAFFQFSLKGFHYFVFSVAAGLLVTIGFALFVVPGVILLAILVMAPVLAIIDNQSVWSSIRESGRIFKRQHWKIILLLVCFGFGEFIISAIVQALVLDITNSFLAIAICHIFLNTLFLPLFYLILASFVLKWKEELSLFSIDHQDMAMQD